MTDSKQYTFYPGIATALPLELNLGTLHNFDLLDAGIDWAETESKIDRKLRQWDQEQWAIEKAALEARGCGTAFCQAGLFVLVDDVKAIKVDKFGGAEVRTARGHYIPDAAAQIAGFTRAELSPYFHAENAVLDLKVERDRLAEFYGFDRKYVGEYKEGHVTPSDWDLTSRMEWTDEGSTPTGGDPDNGHWWTTYERKSDSDDVAQVL